MEWYPVIHAFNYLSFVLSSELSACSPDNIILLQTIFHLSLLVSILVMQDGISKSRVCEGIDFPQDIPGLQPNFMNKGTSV